MVLLDWLEIKVFKGQLVLQALLVPQDLQDQQDQRDQLDFRVIEVRMVTQETKVLLGLWGLLAPLEIKALKVLRDHKGNEVKWGNQDQQGHLANRVKLVQPDQLVSEGLLDLGVHLVLVVLRVKKVPQELQVTMDSQVTLDHQVQPERKERLEMQVHPGQQEHRGSQDFRVGAIK